MLFYFMIPHRFLSLQLLVNTVTSLLHRDITQLFTKVHGHQSKRQRQKELAEQELEAIFLNPSLLDLFFLKVYFP